MNIIGIVGDGELGALTAIEARKIGYESLVIGTNGKDSPGAKVSNYIYTDSFDPNKRGIQLLKNNIDVLTVLSEDISVGFLKRCEIEGIILRPGFEVLHITQNKLREKEMIEKLGGQVTPYLGLNNILDYIKADLGKGILKIVDYGNTNKYIFEKLIDFKMEISVIVGRRPGGQMVAFEPALNTYNNGILTNSLIPAIIPENISKNAKNIAMQITEGMGIEGLLSVEIFVLSDGSIVINKLTPGPHNSGNGTIESYNYSQYNILIKAILDEDLGNLELQNTSVMHNLLGRDINRIPKRSKTGGEFIEVREKDKVWYDYGNSTIKDGEKMGHVTKIIS